MDAQAVFDYAGATELSTSDYLKNIKEMEETAKEIMPSIKECTFDLGHIKQPIFSCLTCQKANNGVRAGVCGTCAVMCHGDHDLVELFERRNFQCDCGTTRLGKDAVCDPGKRMGQQAEEGNKYDTTFDNIFCMCGRKYDPHTEDIDMIECCVCENWYHETCLIPKDSFDTEFSETLICSKCASTLPLAKVLAHNVGLADSGFIFVEQSTPPIVHGQRKEEAEGEGAKRSSSPSDSEERPTKKRRLEKSSVGSASNTPNGKRSPSKEKLKENPAFTSAQQSSDFKASVFLQEGYMDRWCQCANCQRGLKDYPFLLEEEESLEVESDAGHDNSVLDYDKQLDQLPRSQAINIAHGMKTMSSSFASWLGTLPVPSDGSPLVVTKEHIQNFMEYVKQQSEAK